MLSVDVGGRQRWFLPILFVGIFRPRCAPRSPRDAALVEGLGLRDSRIEG